MLRKKGLFAFAVPAACSALLLAALCHSAGAQTSNTPPEQMRRDMTSRVPDGFTLAAVGDASLARPISPASDPGLASTLRWIQSSDVAFANFENNAIDLRRFAGYPAAETGGMWLVASPAVAEVMKAMGFAMVSHANNHAEDWGIAGMRATDHALDAVGLVHAGTGDSLAAACAPRYLETPQGRIALVAVTSTFTPMSVAADPLGEVPGRPGVCALPAQLSFTVDPQTMQALRRFQAALPEGSSQPYQPSQNELNLFGLGLAPGVNFVLGRHAGFFYRVDQQDLNEILRAVRQGKETSDFLILSIHAHEPGNWSDAPADFIRQFAYAAIQAGADAVVGHGPHQLRGIEIYEGKPIFYSLGNFFFQNVLYAPDPLAFYREFGANPQALTATELNETLLGPHVNKQLWFQSLVAVSTFRGGKVAEIRLHPIDLGLNQRIADRGVPSPASGVEAREILDRLSRLSAPFGSKVQIEGDTGIIRP